MDELDKQASMNHGAGVSGSLKYVGQLRVRDMMETMPGRFMFDLVAKPLFASAEVKFHFRRNCGPLLCADHL